VAAGHAAIADAFGLGDAVGVTFGATGPCWHAATVTNSTAMAARFAVAEIVRPLIDLV
jgi:hypothetical protein